MEFTFTLAEEEQELLLHILERHHQGLLKEIWRTDRREFRLALREDEKLLERMLVRLRGALAEQPRS
jgi:hypothetical protein